jgi:hypothetical protein
MPRQSSDMNTERRENSSMANATAILPEPLPITGDGELVFRKKGITLTVRADHICPECGGKLHGAYPRWAKEPQYGPYWYGAHANGRRGNIRWCYLGQLISTYPEVCPPGGHCLICNHTCKGGTASKRHSNDFLSVENSSPPPTSSLEAPTPSPRPHDKHCAHCDIDYPHTTERRCGKCGGFIIMKSTGRYS